MIAGLFLHSSLWNLSGGKRNNSYKGQWCIPCGHVEWDEDVYEALKRETFEETGLKVEVKSRGRFR
ncbi:NUDIX domain-containing protein [Desulfitispora alkaliphila]|uniref:NUDIX domain-containing protein n=1 Tax=Desulfitispora alkaliphila TaxID=622674 RepID=UPI003D1DCE51